MGQSHFKSNYIGFAGTEYIASVAAIKNVTAMDVVTASVNVMKVTGATDDSYIKMGAQQYMFWGTANSAATVLREASNLVGTPLKGSMYASRKGVLWFFKDDILASPVGTYGEGLI